MQTVGDIKVWTQAIETGCKFIKWHPVYKRWVIRNDDPCPVCKDLFCPQTQRPIAEPNKTIIVQIEERKKLWKSV